MKQYALLNEHNGLYYNFISKQWTKFLTYGCLVNNNQDFEELETLLDCKRVEIVVDKGFMSNNNRVVDEVLVF